MRYHILTLLISLSIVPVFTAYGSDEKGLDDSKRVIKSKLVYEGVEENGRLKKGSLVDSIIYNKDGYIIEQRRYGAFGKLIKKVETAYHEKGYTICEEDYKYRGDVELNKTTIDKNGFEIEHVRYLNDSLDSRITRKYNAKGMPTDCFVYDEKGMLANRWHKEFNKKGQLVLEQKEEYGKKTLERTIRYDKRGNGVELKLLQESETRIYRYTYNKANKQTNVVCTSNGEIIRRSECKYNNNNELEEKTTYSKDNEIIGRIVYVYDAQNREIEKTTYDGAWTERCLTAYDGNIKSITYLYSDAEGGTLRKKVYKWDLIRDAQAQYEPFEKLKYNKIGDSLEITARTIVEYDEDGNSTQCEEILTGAGLQKCKEIKTSKDKRLKETTIFYKIEQPLRLEVEKRDVHGNVTEEYTKVVATNKISGTITEYVYFE